MKSLVPVTIAHDIRREFGFLDRIRFWIELAGIEFDVMKEIAILKATLLVRASPAKPQFSWKGKKAVAAAPDAARPGPDKRFLGWSASMQIIIMSLCLGLMAFIFTDPLAMLAICFLPGFVMQFMDTLTMVPVLVLDTRDATVLAVRPVRARTIAAAKTLILGLRLLQSALAMYGLVLIPFLIKGLWLVLPGYLLAVLLSCLLSVALAYLVYGLVLRFADGEKLKDLITVFQVSLSIITILGYQFISRIASLMDTATRLEFSWWQLAVPPLDLVWLAAIALPAGNRTAGMAGLAVILAFLVLHFCLTGRLVEDNLLKLLGEGEGARRAYRLKTGLYQLMGRLLFRTKEERAFWMLGHALTSNDRRFKQVLYPSMAAFLILPFIFLFAGTSSAQKISLDWVVAHAWWLGLSLHVGALLSYTAASLVISTEKPRGAVTFDGLPIAGPERGLRAAGLNLVLRFGILPVLVMGLLAGLLIGPVVLADVAVVVPVVLVGGLLSLRFLPACWPFSLAIGTEIKGAFQSFGKMMLVCGGLVIAHVLLRIWMGPLWGMLAALPALGVALWLWRSLGLPGASAPLNADQVPRSPPAVS